MVSAQRLGAQLLGATPTGTSVLYDDSTNNNITFTGAAGTKISNVANGTISATSKDAVNGSQLFPMQTALDNISTSAANSSFMQNASGAAWDAPATTTGSIGAVAIGAFSKVSGTQGVAVGYRSVAGLQGVAMGSSANAVSNSSVSIGYTTNYAGAGASSVAVGASAQ